MCGTYSECVIVWYLQFVCCSVHGTYSKCVVDPVLLHLLVGGQVFIDVLVEFVHAPGRVLLHVLVAGVLLLDKLQTDTEPLIQGLSLMFHIIELFMF